MGEYATYQGQNVKIGTCEDLYYLRADQATQITPSPMEHADVYRFRFPWPDEDSNRPGTYGDHDRSLTLWGVSAPAEVDHGKVQFSHRNGYLCSLPCPEGPNVPDGLTIHRNGFGGACSLFQQAWRGGLLVPILKCNGCGYCWNVPTLEDAEPVLAALEAQGEHEIARRVEAGYSA